MRKWTGILAILLTLLLCAGCGGTPEADTMPLTLPTEETEPTELTTAPVETDATEATESAFVFSQQQKILGVDVGGMSLQQAHQAVEAAVQNYVLEATVNGSKLQITAAQAKLTVSMEAIAACAQAEGEAPVLTLDGAALKKIVSENCQTPVVNAAVSYSSAKDRFVVTAEQNGVSIDVQAATEQLAKAMETLTPSVAVTVSQQTLKPTVLQDDQRLLEAADKANQYLQLSLTYVFAQEHISASYHKVTVDDIGMLISFKTDYTPYVNSSAVSRYASQLNQKYAVRGLFQTTGGGYISINTSDVSQAVDTTALASDLKSCLETLTGGTRNAPYKSAGAATVWNGNYVEVDLSRQHLWVYKNGSCVVSTPIVSGCVATDAETPTGVYTIDYKTTNITLRGPTWNDFVYYWMPFYGNYGLHDATWRDQFGSDIYLYDGSHGCVNIPVGAAGQVYANVSAGTHVILYGGVTDVKLEERKFSGTLSYRVQPDAPDFKLDITTADAPALQYSSDAPQVATVSSDGTVTVKGIGTAHITVSAPAHGIHAAGSVTVKITVYYDCGGNHTLTWVTDKEPTCAPGSQTGTCLCGYSETWELEAVRSHVYDNWQTTQPGCEADGHQFRLCLDCGHKEEQTLPATGHDFSGGDTCANGCGKTQQTP